MNTNTFYLPGFSHRLCGRRSAGVAEQLAGHALKLDGLAALVTRFVPASLFAGAGKRDRVFTPWITFCAFLGQVLQRGASCRDAVRRVQAWHLATGTEVSVDGATGGYCQARDRLPLRVLRAAFERLVQRCDKRARKEDRWQGRTGEPKGSGRQLLVFQSVSSKMLPIWREMNEFISKLATSGLTPFGLGPKV